MEGSQSITTATEGASPPQNVETFGRKNLNSPRLSVFIVRSKYQLTSRGAVTMNK